MLQPNVVAVASLPASVISMTWPSRLTLRGFASVAPSFVPVPRLVLLVHATYTRPVFGFGSTSSQRSILVAPTASAARRVFTSTSAVVKPGDLAHAVDDERHPRAGAVERAVGGQRARAGDLGDGRVAGELGDVQVAGGEELLVVAACARPEGAIELALRDELVEVVEALVIALVGRDVPGPADDDVGALVLEPAECGVLHGRARSARAGRSRRSSRTGWARCGSRGSRPSRSAGPTFAPSARVTGRPEAVALLGRGLAGVHEVAVEVLLAATARCPTGWCRRRSCRACRVRSCRWGRPASSAGRSRPPARERERRAHR